MKSVQSIIVLLFVSLQICVITSLDIKLEKATCDSSLPATANVYMKCENGARCTFGETVTIYGTLHYNNVENSGVQNQLAYMTSNLELWTLNFNLFDMLPVPLCDETLVASEGNSNACPGSGSYDFSVTYTLPSAGNPKTSWFATGWSGEGIIQMFAQVDDTMKIGECALDLQTFVTRQDGSSSLLAFPSAAVASGMFLALFLLFLLISLYCMLCKRARPLAVKKPTATISDEDSYFTKMEDAKSYKSSKSKRSQRNVTSGSSVKTELI